ncbi:MAG: outer membrane lipoprotein carrier protein LolA [Bacteroidales bacterium]|nr:outer membrane lipoprotein carrier protein LolA [Bacteroidales bacterium]
MMRRIITFAATLLLACAAYAQDFRQASPEESAEILSKVELSPAEVGSLKCDFVQTRHSSMLKEDLVSKGKLTINAPKSLVWEVTSPYKSSSQVALDSDKRLAAMSRKNDFSKTVYVSDKEYKIVLVPLKRDMKQLFTKIEATVLRSSGDVRKVVMYDASGDSTTIEFSHVER